MNYHLDVLLFLTASVGVMLTLAWAAYKAGLKSYAFAMTISNVAGNVLVSVHLNEVTTISGWILVYVSIGIAWLSRRLMRKQGIGPFAKGGNQEPSI